MNTSSLLRSSLSASLLIAFGSAYAGEPKPDRDRQINEGREIFERVWKHESAPTLKQAEDENQWQFAQRLRQQPGDGLGPMYNATSCEDCHVKGGGAGIERNVTLITADPRNAAITETLPKRNNSRSRGTETRAHNDFKELYPGFVSPSGQISLDVVVHEKSARPFYDSIRSDIGRYIPGGARDEWFLSSKRTVEAVANEPVLAGRMGDVDFYLSQRNSPPLFGLGMIDKIEISRLSLLARSQARRTDGKITGRVGAGKFGWRAQTPTLDQFVRGACAGELGLQVGRTPQPVDAADPSYTSMGVDLQEPEVNSLVSYVRSLPQPIYDPTEEDSSASREGKRLFSKVGCVMCHVKDVSPARDIYSDLLLHDMGDLLQAPSPAPMGTTLVSVPRMTIPIFRPNVVPPSLGGSVAGYYGSPGTQLPKPYPIDPPAEPQFPRGHVPKDTLETNIASMVTWDMLQREWRTPPLWGVADSAPYMHDGSAPTLDAAIRHHKRDAAGSGKLYEGLNSNDRKCLIAFLKTLRSPFAENDTDAQITQAQKLSLHPQRVSMGQE